MTVLCSVAYVLLCAVGSGMLTRSLFFSRESAVSRCLAWIALFFSMFFGGFHVLGYIDLFTDYAVVDSPSALFIATIVLIGCRHWVGKSTQSPSDARITTNHPRSKVNRILPGSGSSRALAITCIAAFFLLALMISVGFPRGYEAQGYHLPIGVQIFQSHSLKVWQVWSPVFFHTLPANASLLFGFLLGFVPEHIVAPANLVFLATLAVAAYGIGRATGGDENASLLAALGLVTMPIVVAPALDAVADVGGLAFLAIAVYFVLSRPTGQMRDLAVAGLSAGLAFGFKSLHLVSITFLFMMIVFQIWRQSRTTRNVEGLRNDIRALSLFLASIFVTSGFWLVRNYVQLGNPLYPVHLRVFDIFGWTTGDLPDTLMPQELWVRSPAEWWIYPWVEWMGPNESISSKHGPGPFFAATVPVSCLMAFFGIIKGDKKRLLISSLLGGGLFALAIQMWVINDRQPRHSMGALVFLVPLVAWTMTQAFGFFRKAFDFVAVSCISITLLMTVSIELVEFGTRHVYGRQLQRWSYYQYPEAIDRLPQGSTIVNLGHRTRNYSLSGAAHHYRIVNYMEAIAALQASTPGSDEAPHVIPLSYRILKHFGATHIVTEGRPDIILDECVALREIDALSHDTLGNLLTNPIRLYSIDFCN